MCVLVVQNDFRWNYGTVQ